MQTKDLDSSRKEKRPTILLLRCSPQKMKKLPNATKPPKDGHLASSLPEVQDIEKVWTGKKIDGSVVNVETLTAANATEFIEAMMNTNLRIVHISAHLDFDLFGEDSILFVDKVGRPSSVPAKNLVSMLQTRKETLDLIVLNGCNSRTNAWKLVDECGVKAVIGWRTVANDAAARVFGVALHKAMTNGHGPGKAFEIAKEALKSHPDENMQFYHGVLKSVHPNMFVLVDPDKFISEDDKKCSASSPLVLYSAKSEYSGRIKKPETRDMAYRVPAGIPVFSACVRRPS